MKSRILSIALCVVMILAVVLSFASCGGGSTETVAESTKGTFGNIKWDYSKENKQTLTLKLKDESKDPWINDGMTAKAKGDTHWNTVASSVKNIVFEGNIRSIGDYAFYDMTSLESVDFKDAAVEAVGKYAFAFCKSLTEINLPASVSIIEEGAFSSCGITSITLSAGDVAIGSRAFEYCTALEKVTIHGTVNGAAEKEEDRHLEADMFSYCRSLKTIEAPAETIKSLKITVKNKETKNIDITEEIAPVETQPVETQPAVTEPPVATDAPTDTTADTKAPADTGNKKDDKKNEFGAKEIIAIVALVVLVIAIIVGVIIFIRYDKKHSGNTTTVVKNKDKKDDKGKKK